MTRDIALLGATIFDGENRHEGRALLVREGRVAAITAPQDLPAGIETIALDGGLVVPGFVDLQVNGGGGVLFGAVTDAASLAKLCAAHFPFGTTALLPTLITDTREVTRAALAGGADAARQGVPGFAGLHLEGPHLSLARKGAHNPHYIRPMEEDDLQMLLAARETLPALLTTVATESVSPGQIARLAAGDVVVSLGHTDTDAASARASFEAGAKMVTHLFNAMSQLGNREPGLVGAALTSGVWAGLIADGLHVDATGIAIALRAKAGPGRIFLVTDAMPTAGTDMAAFTLNGREILRRDGALRLADGTLAGADLTMIEAVRYMHNTIGLDLDEVLKMASLYPAQAIGLEGALGHLKSGADASFVHLSDGLDIHAVWVRGSKVWG